MICVFCLRITIFCLLTGLLAGCQSPKRCCCQRDTGGAPSQVGKSVLEVKTGWQSDDGTTCKLADFHGHPLVISMFFSSCEGVCLITKNDMQAVEASLPSAVREAAVFVLVTLDPDHDTPTVLHQYRVEHGLSTTRWRLLRGSPADTAALATLLGIGYGRDTSGRFKHSSEINVLDGAGNIVFAQAVQAVVAASKSSDCSL